MIDDKLLTNVRNRHYLALDIMLIILCSYMSWVLRYEAFLFDELSSSIFLFGAIGLTIIPVVFQIAGVYSRYWRYASLNDIILFLTSLLVSIILISMIFASIIWVGQFSLFVLPRTIPIIFFLLCSIFLPLPRVVTRIIHWNSRKIRASRSGRHVAIFGAGDAGEALARELNRDPHSRLHVRAFLDDDKAKQGKQIHGITVIGGRERMAYLKNNLAIEQVVIAMPSIGGKTIREIVTIASEAGLNSKILPSVEELLENTGLAKQVRNVAIEDLLRRPTIHTDTTAVQSLIAGKRVLITGAGGSIGSELCRQVLRCHPAELILLGHGENSIFGIMHELKKGYPRLKLHAKIADVRFLKRVTKIFQESKPDIVFHAAAHKHVPLMELNPTEAITNNVLGTRNLLDASLHVGVDHFVMISTDKAVNPTNIMGASKRAAELLVHQAALRSQKPYVAVRFGNVLGSRGSVVPTFKKQIETGGPVTVTHPEMTRFFMTIPEAVQLVLQAAVLGAGGEVFVLDMGEPVKIVDLAKDLIRLSGLELGKDIDIEFVGLRPGEKMYEELFVSGEEYNRTKHSKIFLATHLEQKASEFSSVENYINQLIRHAMNNELQEMLEMLSFVVPEHQPKEPVYLRNMH